MLEAVVGALVTLVPATVAFISVIRKRLKLSDDARKEMIALLMGLAQNKIVREGLAYLERGHITVDEYHDLRKYLFEPYRLIGGNGTVERIMHAVERLPFREEVDPLVEKVVQEIPIRETDPTGLPNEKPVEPYEGEDRRGKREHKSDPLA